MSGTHDQILDIYFLLRLPFLLPSPLGDPGVPIDTGHWDVEGDLLRANQRDQWKVPDVDTTLPSTAIQFACSTVARDLRYEDLAESWSHLPHVWPWVKEKGDAPRPEPAAEWVSLLSVRVTPRDGQARFEEEQDAFIAECFETAISWVRELLEVLALATAAPMPAISPADLEPVLPFSVRYRHPGQSDPAPVGPFLNESSLAVLRFQEPRPLSKGTLDAALAAAARETPYLRANALHMEAQWAVRVGDYWSAVLKSAVYSEMVLHTTARLLAWESGMTPEEGRRVLAGEVEGSLTTFASTHVGKRLGGTWDAQRRGPIQSWNQSVVITRNRLLHAGERASKEEAEAAVRAAGELLNFIKDRLLEDKNLSKHPVTAVSLWGKPRLSEQGKWTRRVRERNDDAGPDAYQRFTRWNRSLDAPDFKGEPDESAILATAIFEVASGEVRWVLRALGTPWAAEAEMSDEDIECRIRDAAREELSTMPDPSPEHLVFSLTGFRSWTRTHDWLLAHHLLPDAACML